MTFRLTLFALALAGQIQASGTMLKLDASSSTLVASSLKNESVTVKVSFPQLSGMLDTATAQGGVSADLVTLSTGDLTRDHNIHTFFFEAVKPDFAQAVFRWNGKPEDLKALQGLKKGKSLKTELQGELTLHGVKTNIGGPATLSRDKKGAYRASFSGWKLSIAALKMGKTLKALNKLCPQPHRVADEVKLDGDLVFK